MNSLPDRSLKIEVLVENSCSASTMVTETEESGTMLKKVQILNVNSGLLSEKSQFFCKLFCNGMRESNQKCVSLQIDASEEIAFMDLLNFMESNTLTATTVSSLLDVLKVADKFEVPSCIEYCSNHLFEMPMTLESSLEYLQLPFSVQFGTSIHPLLDSAKGFLVSSYNNDIRRYKDKIFSLPLAAIEALLSSDDLQVSSEDALYDMVMEWTKHHYPTSEHQRKILTSILGHYIRFPYMSFSRLMKILSSNDFDDEFASRVVLEALIFKCQAPYHQRILAQNESISSTSRRFVERCYKYRPIKVVEFDHPYQQCLVYLDLKQPECKNLYPSKKIYSQAFQLGGQVFFLYAACCNFDESSCNSPYSFGLFLGMKAKNSRTFEIKYEFSARSKLSEGFISKHKGDYTFTGGKAVGSHNLFGIPWDSFIDDIDEDGLYFIDGMLHLRVELTIIGRRPNVTLSM